MAEINKKITKLNNAGFHVLELLIVLITIGIIAFVGFKVINKKDDKNSNTASSSSTNKNDKTTQIQDKLVLWSWNGDKWAAEGKAPECPEPLKFKTTPSDLSKATSVLYPGQTRGGNYKPHGGLGFSNETNNIEVKAIMDAYITEGVRYIEAGEVQYMFWFQNSCGVAYRYDHLLTLSSKLQDIANKLPEAKVDDSRTTRLENPVKITEGDVIATAVGFAKTKNVSYDIGVYDLRKRNEAASKEDYLNKHKMFLSQAGHALCWLDMFSDTDSARLLSLPSRDMNMGKTSDYCKS